MPFPRLPKHHDFTARMETKRVQADASSADYVSWIALQSWTGRWDIFFCDYIPADKPSRVKGQKTYGAHVIHTKWGPKNFLAAISSSRLCARGLSTADALAHLASREAEFGCNGDVETPLPTHHYANFMTKNGENAPPHPLRK